MNTDNASLYVKWLKQEVAPALGCTEPVAISFAAAYAAQYLDQPCTKISGFISANLYKNAMGVTIPGTTVCGVPLAAAIGAFGGDKHKVIYALCLETPAALIVINFIGDCVRRKCWSHPYRDFVPQQQSPTLHSS